MYLLGGLSVVIGLFVASTQGGYLPDEAEGVSYEIRMVNASDVNINVREEVRVDKEQNVVIIDTYTSDEATKPEYSFILDMVKRQIVMVMHSQELCFLYSISQEDIDKGYFLPTDKDFHANHTFAEMMKVKLLHSLAESDWVSTTTLDENEVDPMMANQCVDFTMMTMAREQQGHHLDSKTDGGRIKRARPVVIIIWVPCTCCCCCCCYIIIY